MAAIDNPQNRFKKLKKQIKLSYPQFRYWHLVKYGKKSYNTQDIVLYDNKKQDMVFLYVVYCI